MSTTRRSKRITAAGTTTGTQANLTDAQPDDDLVRPTKRRKVTSVTRKESKAVVHRRNGKGKLRNLPLMPLDVLYEIFGHLLPLDLLCLARTTKDFRSILMKRSASSLWKTTFENIPDTPAKPTWVSEPLWANFLFTTTCYECLAPQAKHAFGGNQVRYCNNCVLERVYFDALQDPRLREDLRSMGLSPETPGLAYTYQISFSGRHGYKSTWLRSDIEDLKNDYARIGDDLTVKTAFLDERVSRFKDMMTANVNHRAWDYKASCRRANEVCHTLELRSKDIQRKLRESGWGDEIDTLTEHQLGLLKKCPSTKVARPLTDRTWKKIEPEFAPLMKSFREERLKAERAAILAERRQLFAEAVKAYHLTQPWDSILPSVADLYFLPSFSPFKTQIEEDPNEAEYTSSSFDAILSGMPQYCRDWKAEFTEAVLEVANEPCITKKDNPPITYDVETLHLARTVFMCSQCNDPLQYPYILTHSCFRPTPWRHRRAPEMDQATMDLDTIAWKEVFPCNLDLLPLAPVIAIIKACGCDPETATAADMDAANVWLIRHYPDSPLEVMRWRKAIRRAYPYDYHYMDPVRHWWTKVDDKSLIKSYNAAELEFYTKSSTDCPVVCSHCFEKPETSRLVEHVKGHKPDGSLTISDFFVHPGADPLVLFSLTI